MQMSKGNSTVLSVFCSLILLALISFNAEATCSFVNGAKKASLYSTYNDYTRNPGSTDYVSKSLIKTAKELATAFGVSTAYANVVTCTAGETLIIGNSDYLPKGDYLETNLNGVVANAQGQNTNVWKYPINGGNETLTLNDTGNINSNYITSGNKDVSQNIVLHQIFKGKISQGGEVPGGRLFNISTSDGLDILDLFITGFSVSVPSCTVNNYDSQVNLGTAYAQNMKGVGQSTNATDFAISLSCNSTTGLSGGLTPTLTFSGDATGKDLDVFANNGTATGVGVQLSYNGKIIIPNSVTPITKVNGSNQTTQTYSFIAKLHQINEDVEPGSVSAVAVFTLDYQ